MKVLCVASTMILFLTFLENVEGKMNFQQLLNAAKGPRKSCIKSTECPQDLVDATKNGEFPLVPELKCFFKCMLIKMKVIKNDQISWAAMNQQMDLMINADLAERYAIMVESCKLKATSEDLCEAGYEFAKCSWEFDNTLYFYA